LKNRNIETERCIDDTFFGKCFLRILDEEYNLNYSTMKNYGKMNIDFDTIFKEVVNKKICSVCKNYEYLIIFKKLNKYNSCCDYLKHEIGNAMKEFHKKTGDFYFLKESYYTDGVLDFSYFNHEDLADFLYDSNRFHTYWCLKNINSLKEVSTTNFDITLEFEEKKVDEERVKNILKIKKIKMILLKLDLNMGFI